MIPFLLGETAYQKLRRRELCNSLRILSQSGFSEAIAYSGFRSPVVNTAYGKSLVNEEGAVTVELSMLDLEELFGVLSRLSDGIEFLLWKGES